MCAGPLRWLGGDPALATDTIYMHPEVVRSAKDVGELIDRAENIRARDGFIELLANGGKLPTDVLLEGFRFEMGRFARSSEVVQNTIELCRVEVSISAVLYELTGFIANPQQMWIKKEVGPALSQVQGHDRTTVKVRLGIAQRCKKNIHEIFLAV